MAHSVLGDCCPNVGGHNLSHFFVKHSDYRTLIGIANLAVWEGELLSKVLDLVIE